MLREEEFMLSLFLASLQEEEEPTVDHGSIFQLPKSSSLKRKRKLPNGSSPNPISIAKGNKRRKKENGVVAEEEKGDDCYIIDPDECVILDYDPFESIKKVTTTTTGSNGEEDTEDVSVVEDPGQVACRDYPHSRHLCVKFPFDETPHRKHCKQCYCYVCDSIAPCKFWSSVPQEHCDATEENPKWKALRNKGRQVSTLARKAHTVQTQSRLDQAFDGLIQPRQKSELQSAPRPGRVTPTVQACSDLGQLNEPTQISETQAIFQGDACGYSSSCISDQSTGRFNKCFYCGCVDHSARECPLYNSIYSSENCNYNLGDACGYSSSSVSDQSTERSHKCFYCGCVDHSARECPLYNSIYSSENYNSKDGKSTWSSNKCLYCGCVDHLAGECPLYNSNYNSESRDDKDSKDNRYEEDSASYEDGGDGLTGRYDNCFRFGSVDHRVRECPMNNTRQQVKRLRTIGYGKDRYSSQRHYRKRQAFGPKRRAKRRIPQHVRWNKPAYGFVVLNTDASRVNQITGGGGAIRNSDGEVIAAFCNSYGDVSINLAELRAIIDGLRLCVYLALDKIEIQTDSTTAKDWLRSENEVPWSVKYWKQEFLALCTDREVSVSHIFREANKLADALASLGRKASGYKEFIMEFPAFVSSISHEDSNGSGYLRF